MAADATAFSQEFISTSSVARPVQAAGEPAATIEVTFDGTTCGADLSNLVVDSSRRR